MGTERWFIKLLSLLGIFLNLPIFLLCPFSYFSLVLKARSSCQKFSRREGGGVLPGPNSHASKGAAIIRNICLLGLPFLWCTGACDPCLGRPSVSFRCHSDSHLWWPKASQQQPWFLNNEDQLFQQKPLGSEDPSETQLNAAVSF